MNLTMNQLFYQLIHNTKSKRWFLLLAVLEDLQQVTANELAQQTGYSIRTINADIKSIKVFFGLSIHILGDGQGYHFSLQDPVQYTKKKQALIENEPLFFYLENLFSGTEKTNLEWVEDLSLSTASFSRIKRVLTSVLATQYSLKITSTNQLEGEEAAIRQLMYDFYYTLPLYPPLVEEKVSHMKTDYFFPVSGRWQLDAMLVSQWIQVAILRIANGYELPRRKNGEAIEKLLAEELAEIILVTLPPQEQAALFLLSLKEEQFIDQTVQQVFIRQFSPVDGDKCLESTPASFFETIVYLMNHFFQLPKEAIPDNSEVKNDTEKAVRSEMMNHYMEVKNQIQYPVRVSFELVGSAALKNWIEKKVYEHLKRKGWYLLDSNQEQMPLQVRKVKITNKLQNTIDSTTISLSEIPEEEEIIQTVQKILN
ncbi:HTH domain-containing protein [Enterococcus casseliflavus]|nr:HTH domain-containing protein [Enterococcus casseliflavus]MBO1142577.1 HTH domain-containing protein [Enterococcus casseliflavus]